MINIIKRTQLPQFMFFREGDELLDAVLTNGNEQMMIAARNGRCVRFEESDVRALGRSASGVRGINIEGDDEVVGVITYDPHQEDAKDHTVLVVSEHGLGKRSDPEDYRLTARGSKGVKTLNITEKTGKVVAIKNVTDQNDLMIITRSGLTIRLEGPDIKICGRATQGVKLINLREGDSIAAVSVVTRSDEDETEVNGTESAEVEKTAE